MRRTNGAFAFKHRRCKALVGLSSRNRAAPPRRLPGQIFLSAWQSPFAETPGQTMHRSLVDSAVSLMVQVAFAAGRAQPPLA